MAKFTSLHLRLQLTAAAVLLIFVVLTALALERAFGDSAQASMEERLMAQLYLLMAATEVDAQGQLQLPERLSEARLGQPASGLYARIDSPSASLWRSPSTLGVDPMPQPQGHEGQHFARQHDVLFAATLWVQWEHDSGSLPLAFTIAEDSHYYQAQMGQYRRSLWGWLGAMALLLLLALGAAISWGLRPLRRVATEIRAIENGRQQGLHGHYPREIRQLSDNLNTLLQHERAQQSRYQHALADLAHSLKTPLAVLRSLPERPALLDEQVQRMDHIVQYQLQRAATAGRSALAQPIPLRPSIERLLKTLNKVYREQPRQVELALPEGARFRGDEGDLLELLGNLLDNAYKWSRTRIRIEAYCSDGQLHLTIEDDGPGIAAEQVAQVLHRGSRLDENTPGHGIGMAMVQDIVAAYGGQLHFERSALGGAAFRLQLPG